MRNAATLVAALLVLASRPLWAAHSTSLRAGVPVVENGRAQAVIVIGTQATPTERHAARELADYVQKMTGARLPIRRVASGQWPVVSEGRALILIGRAETNPLVKQLVDEGVVRLSADEPGLDGYVIQTTDYRPQTTMDDGRWTMDDGPVLVLGGSRDRGTLYAVYDLLERFAHVGFFWDAERIPKLDSFAIPDCAIAERPFFRYRFSSGGGYTYHLWVGKNFEDWKRVIDWSARNKINRVALFYVEPSYFWQVVRARMGIVPEREPTETEQAELDLFRRIVRYAHELDLDTQNINLPSTEANDEFRKAFPDARYFQVQWLDITPPVYHVFAGDPVYRRYVRTAVQVWQEMFPGTGHHYWGAVAYAEQRFVGVSPEELREIVVGFPRPIMESILQADPEGIWDDWSWQFTFDPGTWTKEILQDYFANLPGENFVMSDMACDWYRPPFYTTERGNYWYGKPFMFGIIHAMGGNDQLHGDLGWTLKAAQDVASDPKADKCVGFHISTEIIGYNMLYYDFLCRLAWDPRDVTLDQYLEDFALRRYGAKVGPALVPELKRLAETIYARQWNSEADYQHRLYPKSNPWRPITPQQALQAIDQIQDFLRTLLHYRNVLGDQQPYGNDLVDYARQWITELFNLHRDSLDNAFARGDRETFESEARILVGLLDQVERILSTRPEYRVTDVYNTHWAKGPLSPGDGGRAVRDTGLTFAVSIPAIVDYQSKDIYELVKFYYRPRVEAYIRYLRRRMRAKDFVGSHEDLDKLYKPIEVRWVEEGYDQAEALPYDGTPVEAVEGVFDAMLGDAGIWTVRERLAPRQSLLNGDFEEGLRGWELTRSPATKVEPVEGEAPSGRHALLISIPAQPNEEKACSLVQNLVMSGRPVVRLNYLLRDFSDTANASLLVEGFDAGAQKRFQTVYCWGGSNWDYGNEKPEKTGGVYAVKIEQDSAKDAWHELVADPAADVDRVHGEGTYDGLGVVQVQISIRAWARDTGDNHIEGLVDNVIVMQR